MAQSAARSRPLDRPIKLRRDSDDDISHEDNEDSADGLSDSEVDAGLSDESENDKLSEEDGDTDTEDTEDDEVNFEDISFGALAKAQATLAPASKSQKRKASELEDNPTQSETSYRPPQRGSIKDGTRPNQPIHRTSKHAPTILSSKHPVSRRRTELFEPSPALKHRDPRFDPTVTSTTRNPQSSANANKNYAFLSEYQATEILNLKSQIKKSKDPDTIANLKRQVMSMESKIRNAEIQQKDREIRQRHKREERAAISEGKKSRPYFLKQSDVRKEIEKERLEGMSKKAKETMEKRKIKRIKGKEKRDMPGIMSRRTFDG